MPDAHGNRGVKGDGRQNEPGSVALTRFNHLLLRAFDWTSSSMIQLFTDISLSERARLVHPWPLRAPIWTSPPLGTYRAFPAVLSRFFLARSVIFSLFLFRFGCVRVLQARQHGRARHRRGCQRVVGGRGGVARSAVAVFVARRPVCLET